MVPMISTNVRAEVVKSLKQAFQIKKSLHPENGFRSKPANYDESKPPFSLCKEGMGMLIVGMERQYITI